MNHIVLTRKPSERRHLIDSMRSFSAEVGKILTAKGPAGPEAIASLLAEGANEIEELAKRLEVWEVYQTNCGPDEAFVPIPMPDEFGHMDGIYCRDMTIKCLEAKEEDMTVADVYEKAGACRARGETMMASYLEALALRIARLEDTRSPQ